MSRIKCPYCGDDQKVNHDDGHGYAEDEIHSQECRNCEKTFGFTTAIHFTYSPRKVDCLNDGQHTYEKTKTYPPEFARLRCTQCDHETDIAAPKGGE